ncbi:MAG: peptide chain release factor 2, partial [Patescibacteria group bacterium]|nr:peptide chain release factor 2 [Patescibacteria group bacterium]
MAEDKNEIENKIKKIEEEMQLPDFWSDKNKAQELLRELSDLKREKEGLGKYDRGNAILSIISGAGGDDAEDFSKMLLEMYVKYTKKQGWNIFLIHENQNDHGGFRNVTLEIDGKGAYGKLKNENGVHRLVRVSPFNANAKRHTSFSLVEVLPKFSKLDERDFVIPERDLKIEFSRSSGPGGQNVNKRETAVRVIHVPTGIAVHSSGERSQEHNRERAMNMLRAKIFKKAEMDKKTIEESMKKDAGKDIEWGNQIRSYVLHPYKMVKDHRTNAETSNVDGVLDGDIEEFIEAETNL